MLYDSLREQETPHGEVGNQCRGVSMLRRGGPYPAKGPSMLASLRVTPVSDGGSRGELGQKHHHPLPLPSGACLEVRLKVHTGLLKDQP